MDIQITLDEAEDILFHFGFSDYILSEGEILLPNGTKIIVGGNGTYSLRGYAHDHADVREIIGILRGLPTFCVVCADPLPIREIVYGNTCCAECIQNIGVCSGAEIE